MTTFAGHELEPMFLQNEVDSIGPVTTGPRKTKFKMSEIKEIFSSGGGTQSSAITALIIQGKLPRPDVIVIADTGWERSTTWEYLDNVIRPALKEIGLEVHRCKGDNNQTFSQNGNTVLMPGFTNQSGTVGKLSGFCNAYWKRDVTRSFCRKELGIRTAHQRKWIGFSLDETKRALKMMNSPEYKRGLIKFPLIHDIPTRRQQAIQIVRNMGWPEPPRISTHRTHRANYSPVTALKEDVSLNQTK